MKKLTYIAIAAFALMSVAACNKITTADKTGITYYADIVLEEGSSINWPIGQAWVEPGFTATVKGEDVSNDVVISGKPDIEVPGAYTVKYSHKNVDGYSVSVSRTVYVCDPSVTLDLSGAFTVDPEASTSGGKTFSQLAAARKASYPDTYGPYVSTDYKINFKKIAPGFFYCDDLMGGWYKYIQGRGGYYKATNGSSYFTYFDMTGYVLVDNDGNISYISGNIRAWGDGLDSLSGTFDKETGILSYSWSYADGAVFASPVFVKD